MSVARGYSINGKSIYMNVAKPQYTWLQFTVNAADTGGLGVTSVKSNGYVHSVFMHTSQTPGSVSGITNPNPPAGYSLIRFKNNFNYWLGGYNVQYTPATSTSTTSTTVNSVYIITALGTATLAQWQAVGLPAGLTPTVGQVFVATASQSIGGSATVGVPGVPVAPIISVVGSANTTIANSNIAQYGGAQLMIQFSALSVAGTISAPTFTGSALANHTHTLNLKNAAVADGATTRVNAGSNLLGANTGSDITIAGAGTNGGIANTSAGTPAGTISAPTFTNTSVYAAASPADSTIVYMELCYDASTVTIDGI